MGRKTPGIAIPNAQKAHDDRQVFFQRRSEKMLVHLIGAAQERLEIVVSYGNRHRQADGRPHRITPADPVPEPEDAIFAYAERLAALDIGRNRCEMVVDGLLAQRIGQPLAGGVGVGHGFVSGEGLGRDDEQRPRRIEPLERVVHMRAIDIGNVVRPQIGRV